MIPVAASVFLHFLPSSHPFSHLCLFIIIKLCPFKIQSRCNFLGNIYIQRISTRTILN
nr:MAG TPA: hypothetical protein [Bacteriophage sp.]